MTEDGVHAYMTELAHIRAWNGSQNEAFEELICQLARYEESSDSSDFTRLRGSGGDGGVECYWTSTDGSKHGWQAKWFLALGQTQWRQIDESVRMAIAKHQHTLKKYTVALPINRTDAQKRRWDAQVTLWKEWATSAGTDVEFEFWGETEVFDRLSREEHVGRRHFWFGKDELSFSWMSNRMDEVIKTAGPRYTPEANVEVEIGRSLHAVARTSEFYERIRLLSREAKIALNNVGKPKLADRAVVAALDDIYDCFEPFAALVDNIKIDLPFAPIGFDLILEHASQLRVSVETCRSLMSEIISKSRRSKTHSVEEKMPRAERDTDTEALGWAETMLARLIWPIDKMVAFCESNDARAANTSALLVNGDPGTGKTHLFCDVAQSRIEQQLPTVMLMGEWFSGDEPWSQIIRRLHLSCSNPDEFLGAMQALAETCGNRVLILVDGLNESRNRDSWQDNLPSMLEAISRHPGVALALSCRSTYEKHVIPDILADKLPCVTHHGFVDNEAAAIRAYCRCYGIEEPNVPILRPEFSNPLFLRLFCQSLQGMGETRMSKGLSGITSICSSFVKAINRKLAGRRCLDYDEKCNPVDAVLNGIAERMAKDGSYRIERAEAQAIADAALPGRLDYSRSLYPNLIHEGVLVEFQATVYDRSTKSVSYIDAVKLGFERFTDHIIVRSILSRYADRASLETAFVCDKALTDLYDESSWAYQGWTEALAVQVPEKYACELVDIVPRAKEWQNMREAFLKSLVWRNPRCIYESTDNFLNAVIAADNRQVFNTLVMLAADPDHPYNSSTLHSYLKPMTMPERDELWSTFLYDSNSDDDSTVRRLIHWAWHSDMRNVGEDAIELCGTALGWFLTTSHRFVRDRATKALVSLLKNKPAIAKSILSKFAGVDDLYVQERLHAVAYGVAAITTDDAGLRQLALHIYTSLFEAGKPTAHILLRDYARGVIEVANRRGLLPESIDMELVRPPYHSDWPLRIPSQQAIEEYGKRSEDPHSDEVARTEIYCSLSGDFYRYVVGSHSHWFRQEIGEPFGQNQAALDHFVQSLSTRQKREWNRFEKSRHNITSIVIMLGEEALTDDADTLIESTEAAVDDAAERIFIALLREPQRVFYNEYVAPFLENRDVGKYDVKQIARWVLKRVFDLGWSVELFGHFDRWRSRHWGREGHKPERMGKKYQWIAYHEFLAHVTDHLMMESGDFQLYPVRYSTPAQLSVRDIDPTYIARDPNGDESDQSAEHRWWHPTVHRYSDADPTEMHEWTLRTDDVPPPDKLILLTNPADQSEWLPLHASYIWKEQHDCDLNYGKPHREMWSYIRCCLVEKQHSDAVFVSLAKRNHSGNQLLHTREFGDVFLGEYPWADSCSIPELQPEWTTDRCRLPYPVIATAFHHYGISDYDCSQTAHSDSGFLPSPLLMDAMSLEWSRDGFGFTNQSGELVVYDPSVTSADGSSLLVRKSAAMELINGGTFDLVWVIVGGRWVLGREDRRTSKEKQLSGAYRFVANQLKGSLTEYTQTYGDASHRATSRRGSTLHHL